MAESILEPLLNLTCSDGHRWFSPQRGRFVGTNCGYPTSTMRRKSGPFGYEVVVVMHSCKRKLRRL